MNNKSLIIFSILSTCLSASNPASTDYVDQATLFLNPAFNGQNVQQYDIGDFAQGGVIFWLTPDGQHGLVAAIEEPVPAIVWSDANVLTRATADSLARGPNQLTTGKINTDLIVSTMGIAFSAAAECSSYQITVEGVTYNDWYLPSPEEMKLIAAYRQIISDVSVSQGGMNIPDNNYWTSQESSVTTAMRYSFSGGNTSGDMKNSLYSIRPVRAF